MIAIKVGVSVVLLLLAKILVAQEPVEEECDTDYMYLNQMIFIPNNEVPENDSDTTRAIKTAPELYITVNKSRIPNAGLGVFSVRHIPKGYLFGPYDGIYGRSFYSPVYSWQINEETTSPIQHVDAFDPARSNWLRYVNCPRHMSEMNMMTIEINGEKYYWTCKDIAPGTEMLVYYGWRYAKVLNIDVDNFMKPLKEPLLNADTDLPDREPQTILLLGMPVFAIYLPVVVRQGFPY